MSFDKKISFLNQEKSLDNMSNGYVILLKQDLYPLPSSQHIKIWLSNNINLILYCYAREQYERMAHLYRDINVNRIRF